MEVFQKLSIFRDADEETLQDVAMALRPRIYTPGDFLVKIGRLSNRITFLTEGKAEFIGSDREHIVLIDGANGGVLGERSVIFEKTETASVVARTYVEAFELTKEDFQRITEAHPIVGDFFTRNPDTHQ